MKFQIEIHKLPKSKLFPNNKYVGVITIEGRKYYEETSDWATKDEVINECNLIIRNNYLVGGKDYENMLIQNPKLKKNLK